MSEKPEPRASDSALADELEAAMRRFSISEKGKPYESLTAIQIANIVGRNELTILTALRSNAGKASHE